MKPEANRVIAKYKLHCKSQLSSEVFELLQVDEELGAPILDSHSVGFDILETSYPTPDLMVNRPDWKSAARIITRWDMFEFSVCNIPANADCVTLAVEKGIHLLGEPQPECWEWEDEPNKIVIPKPKFMQKWSDIQKQLSLGLHS